MKKILFILLFIAPVLQAQVVFDTCVVTGRLYNQNGETEDSIKVEIVRTVARGVTRPIIIQTKKTFYTDSAGNVTMTLLRNSDVTFKTNAYGLDGKTLTIPDAATATLASLVPAATVPALYSVAVPNLTIVDSASGTPYSTDSLRLTAGFKVIAPANGGNTPAIQVDVSGLATTDTSSLSYRINVNKDGIAGKADGDSVKTLYDIAGGKGDSDSLKTAYDVLGGKGDSDSLSTATATANAAMAKADSNALHAQKFAVINDRLAGLADGDSVSLQVALIKNIIAALADADSVKLAFDRLGDRENADSTTSKASASLDSALTAGARSFSSNGRIVSLQDSVTLTVAPNETIDLSTGNNFRLTLTANDTLGFSNPIDGQVIQVVVTNAGTHTLTWSGVAWPGGTAPTLTAVANKRSIFSFLVSGSMVHGVSVLNY